MEHTTTTDLAALQAALQAELAALLARFAGGETIAATDPAVLALHATATTHRGPLKAFLDLSPGELPTGTLRTLLRAVGWKLERAGRIKARTGGDRDVCTYTAQRVALPEGVDGEARARRVGSPAALAAALAALEPDPDALVDARAAQWQEQLTGLEDARQALLNDRQNWLAGAPTVQVMISVIRDSATTCHE